VIREASDLLNPILVKELRQGVRANTFTSAFLLLQVLLLVSMAVALAPEDIPDRSGTTAMFWILIALPIGIMVPVSGGSALSSERAQRTLEPLLLTRLSARRIVLGKWAALLALSGLLATSVLPYVLLRYFLGGIDLAVELLGLLDLLVCSALFAAITVGLSAAQLSVPFRWLLALGLTGLLLGQFHGLLLPALFQGRLDVPLLLASPVLLVLLVLAVLEAGAIQVAPDAEAGTSRLRGLALLALLAVGLIQAQRGLASDPGWMLAFWGVGLALVVAVASLCENLHDAPSLYAPYLGRRGPLRLLGLLLCPGWPSGVLFTLALAGLLALCFVVPLGGDLPVVLVGVTAALLLPVGVLRTLLPRARRPFVLYVLAQLPAVGALILCGLVLGSESQVLRLLARGLAGLFPAAYLMLRAVEPAGTQPALASAAFWTTSCGGIALALAQSVRALRELQRTADPRG
jgi:hypothetical protein